MMQRQPKPWWWIPAAEHPGETEDKRSWEVMSAIERYVIDKTKANHGTFELKDDKTGENIPLDLPYVHQPVRRLKSNGQYFACTDFRKAGTGDQFYDIDFWLDGKGNVSVKDAKVHKVPVLKDGSFVQVPRYTFDPKTQPFPFRSLAMGGVRSPDPSRHRHHPAWRQTAADGICLYRSA